MNDIYINPLYIKNKHQLKSASEIIDYATFFIKDHIDSYITDNSSIDSDDYICKEESYLGGAKNLLTHPKTFLDVIKKKPYIRWKGRYPLREIKPIEGKKQTFGTIIDLTKVKKEINKPSIDKNDVKEYFFSKDIISLLYLAILQ